MILVGLKAAYIDKDMQQSRFGQKFIVSRYQTGSPRLHLFQYFAVNLHSQENPEHRLIAQAFKLNPELVLGGGKAKIEGNAIVLHDSSGRFGSVPKRFLDLCAPQLLHDYKEHYSQIQEVRLEVPKESRNDDKVGFLDELMAG